MKTFNIPLSYGSFGKTNCRITIVPLSPISPLQESYMDLHSYRTVGFSFEMLKFATDPEEIIKQHHIIYLRQMQKDIDQIIEEIKK